MLTDLVVREYNCRQYLSMPKEGATIAPIEDIGEVEQPDDNSDLEPVGSQVSNAQINGVPQLESYKLCLKCKARVEPLTALLGRCSKGDCAMMQRYDLVLNSFLHGFWYYIAHLLPTTDSTKLFMLLGVSYSDLLESGMEKSLLMISSMLPHS